MPIDAKNETVNSNFDSLVTESVETVKLAGFDVNGDYLGYTVRNRKGKAVSKNGFSRSDLIYFAEKVKRGEVKA